MTNEKKYTGSGIVLIVNFNGKKYYALNKRTTGPGVVAPDTHAGFFGGTDNDEEKTDPLWAGCRETYEELLILNKKTLKALLYLPYGFLLMLFSIFTFKKARKNFNPTPHTNNNISYNNFKNKNK